METLNITLTGSKERRLYDEGVLGSSIEHLYDHAVAMMKHDCCSLRDLEYDFDKENPYHKGYDQLKEEGYDSLNVRALIRLSEILEGVPIAIPSKRLNGDKLHPVSFITTLPVTKEIYVSSRSVGVLNIRGTVYSNSEMGEIVRVLQTSQEAELKNIYYSRVHSPSDTWSNAIVETYAGDFYLTPVSQRLDILSIPLFSYSSEITKEQMEVFTDTLPLDSVEKYDPHKHLSRSIITTDISGLIKPKD